LLVLLTGLPCTGKSTIAAAVGDELSAPIFSVDPLEAVLLRAGVDRRQRSDYIAYDMAAELAEDQLRRGLPVVVDAVNALEHLRSWFLGIADRHDQPTALIQTVCADRELHRRLVEDRRRTIDGFPYEPTWTDIEARACEYEPPTGDHLVLDAGEPMEQNTLLARRYVLDRKGKWPTSSG
jgi:predicted kinase